MFTAYSVEQVLNLAESVGVERKMRVLALLNLEICEASLQVFKWVVQHVETPEVDDVDPGDCRPPRAQDCPIRLWV